VPVVFEDKRGATEVLKKLRKIPHLVSAVIYDTKYVPFASFGNDVSRNYKCTENGKLECTENGNHGAQLLSFQM
ncbi:MAG: hypothetical protein GZ094_22855, partial [Mariniphaga sp.]|nr:hypothetical protein [Mariniphaga sp.]